VLSEDLRSDPADETARTFLFELLAFAGEYDRAESQLDVLASRSDEAEMGSWLYRAALDSERTRTEMFRNGDFPETEVPGPVAGTLNGEPFETLTDADPRIGARLEVFASGNYHWIPLRHVRSIRMQEPARLRDLKWAPAAVRTGPEFQDVELGEVFLPATTALAWDHPDPDVRLGRVTDWEEIDGEAPAPVGAKLLLVDDEPVPFLEIRELEVERESTDEQD
jgi:type VI secretion system protein ImpE